jgi:undecaprenyl diphosphate synthase
MAFFGKKKTTGTTSSASIQDSARVPEHIAIIMDGNGRWAQSRGLPRIEGHRQGAKSVQTAIEFCAEYRIPYLTLYCFSNENWKRPKQELDFLMGLLKSYLTQQSASLVKNSIRLLATFCKLWIKPSRFRRTVPSKHFAWPSTTDPDRR